MGRWQFSMEKIAGMAWFLPGFVLVCMGLCQLATSATRPVAEVRTAFEFSLVMGLVCAITIALSVPFKQKAVAICISGAVIELCTYLLISTIWHSPTRILLGQIGLGLNLVILGAANFARFEPVRFPTVSEDDNLQSQDVK